MATVTNPGSVERRLSIPEYQEKLAASWDRLGKHSKPDHLHLACRVIAADVCLGRYNPPLM